MTCYGGWELDLEVDGITVPLCARYSGQGTSVLRECGWCCWDARVENALNYGEEWP